MSKRNLKGLVINGLLIILVFNVAILGYRLTRAPVDLVVLTLDKQAVGYDEDLTMTIHNYGFRWISFGTPYAIFREYGNGTIEKFKFPENSAWAAVEIIIGPLIGDYEQRIYTRLEPGNYFVSKEFEIDAYGEYSKAVSFTVR